MLVLTVVFLVCAMSIFPLEQCYPPIINAICCEILISEPCRPGLAVAAADTMVEVLICSVDEGLVHTVFRDSLPAWPDLRDVQTYGFLWCQLEGLLNLRLWTLDALNIKDKGNSQNGWEIGGLQFEVAWISCAMVCKVGSVEDVGFEC
ncbi:hypothetical protein DER46DRAFT_612304 [Fusarium sp. MPI-SDFR-AT-0072]|nr:hypothetical protein DER46DRAFT_612304 [Fusarium sp. MPI-SDFR-AT-0072]